MAPFVFTLHVLYVSIGRITSLQFISDFPGYVQIRVVRSEGGDNAQEAGNCEKCQKMNNA